jgi:hypothetical protein
VDGFSTLVGCSSFQLHTLAAYRAKLLPATRVLEKSEREQVQNRKNH